MSNKTLIGTGILNWPRCERASDRYGSINLNEPGDILVKLPQDLAGRYGELVAEIKETRPSYHIGDFARGLSPSTPDVGWYGSLGIGKVFYGEYETIGLEPLDGRDSDWLNPEILYQLHNQTVTLYFVEGQV